ncbi:hypothetical protein C8Q74DRAFT_1243394 [Fomes fomentarius]|nr:hypothetical protein C8Q74DRAFT_1243394 [Fomes fomentarius]
MRRRASIMIYGRRFEHAHFTLWAPYEPLVARSRSRGRPPDLVTDRDYHLAAVVNCKKDRISIHKTTSTVTPRSFVPCITSLFHRKAAAIVKVTSQDPARTYTVAARWILQARIIEIECFNVNPRHIFTYSSDARVWQPPVAHVMTTRRRRRFRKYVTSKRVPFRISGGGIPGSGRLRAYVFGEAREIRASKNRNTDDGHGES